MEDRDLIIGIYNQIAKTTTNEETIISEMIELFQRFFQKTIDKEAIISVLNS
ncbi:hypothetical protein RCZ02_16550 [Capnocytophaga felis]|uniref:hypothetical protein n=1 Tax=Capnocytophaga felis TaxID=2267611 RepID=UPI0012C9B36F|nr:hypothetical protein [Capnocytophaga felis]GET48824.1 hypothetical protein RCZ02_16550 [Capnocytophaga felis]